MTSLAPLVSCLMVTSESRRALALEAMDCFARQTYPNRQLIVVSDDRTVSDWCRVEGVWSYYHPDVRVLGDLRNLSVEHAAGEFVAQWDDDDLSAPDRLAVQLAAIRTGGDTDGDVDACMLSRVTLDFDFPDGRCRGYSHRHPWECTIVARKNTLGRYPSLPRGEDTPVALATRHELLDCPDLYMRRYHRANTWDEAHFRQHWADRTCDVGSVTGKEILP